MTLLNKNFRLLMLGILCLALMFFVSVFFGGSGISAFEALKAAFSGDSSPVSVIVFSVRLPRAAAAALCGCALSVSGLMLQSTLGNHLASPGILGINNGAGLFVLLSSALLPFSFFGRTVFAFFGALFAAAMVFLAAHFAGLSKSSLILSGVAVSSILVALINLLIFLRPDTVSDKVSFSLGSLAGINSNGVVFAAPIVAVAFVLCFFLAPGVDLFALGDEAAQGLGLNTRRVRFLSVFAASVLAGAAVSLCGLISFVGLICPNLISLKVKRTRPALLQCAVWGAAFLLFCDFLSRMIFYPYEIPVGVILSLIGAPFFLFLLTKRRRKNA